MEPPRTRIRVEGGNWPSEIFARFGLRALEDVPAADFDRPSLSLATVLVDITRNCLPNPYTPPEIIGERSYLKGTQPTEVCREPTGPPTADVPSVVGLPLEAAVRVLESAGLRVERRSEDSVTLPPGYVVRQDPASGPPRKLASGFVVRIWISTSARATARVPDVVGLDAIAATEMLEDVGFSVATAEECPPSGLCDGPDAAPGQVWRQDPPADDEAPAHSRVRIWAYPSE
jgi:hypothetical protein